MQEAIQTRERRQEARSLQRVAVRDAGQDDFLDLNDRPKTLTDAKQAASLDREEPPVLLLCPGIAYSKAHRYEDARQLFEATSNSNPKFERGFYNLGASWKALGNQSKALEAFRKATVANPGYGGAWQEIGRIQASRGESKSAVASYSKAIQLDPANAQAMSELAVLEANGGDYGSAEGLFQRALGVKDDAKTNDNMATVKLQLGKAQDAVTYAEKAVSEEPNEAIYQYRLGLAYERTGKVDGAIAAYTQAANFDKNYVDPRINLGKIYNSSGFPDKALTVLEEAYAADPKSFEANNNLADAYNRKGLFDKAVFHWEISLNLAPQNTVVRMNLAKAYFSAKQNRCGQGRVQRPDKAGQIAMGRVLRARQAIRDDGRRDGR